MYFRLGLRETNKSRKICKGEQAGVWGFQKRSLKLLYLHSEIFLFNTRSLFPWCYYCTTLELCVWTLNNLRQKFRNKNMNKFKRWEDHIHRELV